MAAHQAPPSLGFSRQGHWSGLPFPYPMHESEKWKWSHSVVSDSSRPHGLQPTRLLCPWDFPGKSTGVGCRCLLRHSTWGTCYISQGSQHLQGHPIGIRSDRRWFCLGLHFRGVSSNWALLCFSLCCGLSWPQVARAYCFLGSQAIPKCY